MFGDGSIRQGQAEGDFFAHESQCAGGELSASRDALGADATLQMVKLDSHCFELWSCAAIVWDESQCAGGELSASRDAVSADAALQMVEHSAAIGFSSQGHAVERTMCAPVLS